MHHPLLTSVEVVCRYSALAATIGDVALVVDIFVDPAPLWTLPYACERTPPGLLRLLERIADREAEDTEPLLKQQNLTRALVQAVRHGDLPVVEWLVEQYMPTGILREPVYVAAYHGQLAVLKWLWLKHAARMVWSGRELKIAVKNNHQTTAQWLYDSIPVFDNLGAYELFEMLEYAAANGNTAMVQWVDVVRQQTGVVIPNDVVVAALVVATRRGHYAVMQYIRHQFDVSYRRENMEAAVRGEQLDMAQLLFVEAQISSIRVSDLENAARHGNTKLITWAFQNLTFEHMKEVVTLAPIAAMGGHLEVVRLLVGRCGKKRWTAIMDGAAGNGHLEIVKWLHENRTDGCTTRAMNQAALNGHFDVIKWLHANRSEGCTAYAMDGAAKEGHLAIVKWLHANRSEGCTSSAMDQAALGGHLEVVKWLHENRSEGCTAAAMDNAASGGHLEMVKWLHSNRNEGCTVRAMDSASTRGHLVVLKWLFDNRTEGCSAIAFDGAARFGHVGVVKWLLANKPDDFSADAMEMAAFSGDFELLWSVDVFGTIDPDISWLFGALSGNNYEVFEWLLCKYGHAIPCFGEQLRRQHHSAWITSYVQDVLQRLSFRMGECVRPDSK